MPNLAFNNGIPFSSNNPSNDQPIMLANNVSNQSIWEQDHLGFNVNNSGTHQKVTFYQVAAPIVPGVDQSQIFPAYGTAAPAVVDAKFVNQNATYILNCVRAFGSFNFLSSEPDGPIAILNSMNVVSVTKAGLVYTIAITPNAFTGTNAVLLSRSAVVISAANTLQFTTVLSTSGNVSFAILQA